MLRFMEEQKNTNKSYDSIIQRHEIEQMKAELKSIKGLLLNKYDVLLKHLNRAYSCL